jgi:hypothetical protein
MNPVRLYCVTHKPFTLPDMDNVHLLQVGNAQHTFANLRDNTGDNIATKNPYYSELTAHYFIWKNRPSDKVGFCHYRRYLLPPTSSNWLRESGFARHSSGFRVPEAQLLDHLHDRRESYIADFAPLLEKAEFLLPKASANSAGFINQYMSIHDAAPLFRVLALLAEQDDKLGKVAYRFLTTAQQSHWNNMFFARWEAFDRYCQFLFPLFERLEGEIALPQNTYQQRVYAFLSERLFNFWLAYSRTKVAMVDWAIVEESLFVSENHHVNAAG